MPFPHLELARRTAVTTLALSLGSAVLLPGTAYAAAADRSWPGHPGRQLVTHVVRPGETPSGLAVRYHAWTRELVGLNRVRHDRIYIGQALRIPVVAPSLRPRPAPKRHHATRPKPVRHAAAPTSTSSRTEARRTIVSTANRYGVPPELALALSWQESGWQQQVVSPAHAVGVMQVLPDTGVWMSLYAGRRLHLRDLQDNVTAGVLLLKLLRSETSTNARALAAYYQGIGSVSRHGILPVSRPYVRNVFAIRRALRHGWLPA